MKSLLLAVLLSSAAPQKTPHATLSTTTKGLRPDWTLLYTNALSGAKIYYAKVVWTGPYTFNTMVSDSSDYAIVKSINFDCQHWTFNVVPGSDTYVAPPDSTVDKLLIKLCK